MSAILFRTYSTMKSSISTALSSLLLLLLLSAIPSHSTAYSSACTFPNPRLEAAFGALQALKTAITCDANNFTANWVGCDVCSYRGVYCAPAPDDPCVTTVAGVDLNHAGVGGYLPEELGRLADVALLHFNSNQFVGVVPESFRKLRRLFELDLSNNKLSGGFPAVVLELPSLKFLDIRFNDFQGSIPSELFNMKLDALFLNDNYFTSTFPSNLCNSPVSVLVLANNPLCGRLPSTITAMSATLNELLLINVGLSGCLPSHIGELTNLQVLDVSFNNIAGTLPRSIAHMRQLEQLNVAYNRLTGDVPAAVCSLPSLRNFTFSFNYFCGEPQPCFRLRARDDRFNCIPNRPLQRSAQECDAVLSYPVQCEDFGFSPSPAAPPTQYVYPPSYQ